MQADAKKSGKFSLLVNKHYRARAPIQTILSDPGNRAHPPASTFSIIQAANACNGKKLTEVNKQYNEADGCSEGDAKPAMKNLQQSRFEQNQSAT